MSRILLLALLVAGCAQQPVYVGEPDAYTSWSTGYYNADANLWDINQQNQAIDFNNRLIDIGNDNMIRMSEQLNRNHSR